MRLVCFLEGGGGGAVLLFCFVFSGSHGGISFLIKLLKLPPEPPLPRPGELWGERDACTLGPSQGSRWLLSQASLWTHFLPLSPWVDFLVPGEINRAGSVYGRPLPRRSWPTCSAMNWTVPPSGPATSRGPVREAPAPWAPGRWTLLTGWSRVEVSWLRDPRLQRDVLAFSTAVGTASLEPSGTFPPECRGQCLCTHISEGKENGSAVGRR